MPNNKSRIMAALKPPKHPGTLAQATTVRKWGPPTPGKTIGAAIGAPPAPAAPAGPTNQPMPWDTNYESTVNNLGTDRTNALANIGYENAQGEKQFGFTDTSDPYNNLKMLQQHFEQAKRGALNSMAARGHLYSGAAQNAQNLATDDYNKQYAGQQKAYQDFQHGQEQKRLGAESNFSTGTANATYARLLAALQNSNT
jgi:hypothetical protein